MAAACAAAPGSAAWNAADLERLVDSQVKEQLSRLEVPGAVVVVVKDGSVVLDRGYGFADMAKQVAMSADRTLVRPGSISKLFTAIAVVELANEGRLDLDRDVNDYLDFHIPTPAGGVPVTLRLLLGHRAGFEDHLKDLFAAGTPPEPLGRWLRRSLPVRLFPNGDVPAYSNYGYALAGYIVARASGVRFEEYAETHILKPLGMERSTFEQPPPEALAALVSRGYLAFRTRPLEYFETVVPAPAGGMSATGADMGRFLLALLKGDGVEGARLAYEEDYAAGNRFEGKHGLTNVVVSYLGLLPEAGFGMFVSYNGGGAMDAPQDLLRAIAERYFKRQPGPIEPLATAPADAAAVGGAYQPSQRADSNFLRWRALAGQLVVRPLADGRIAAGPQPLVETAPLVWENSHDLKISFRQNARGMSLRLSAMPLAMEYQRVPWYLDRRLVLPAIGASLATITATLLLWPMAALWRRRTKPFGTTAGDRRGHLGTRLVLGVDLLVVVGGMRLFPVDLTKMNAALDPWLVLLYGVAWLGVAGSAVVVWIAFRFWRGRVGGRWARIHQTLLAASAVIFAWFAVTWRLAGTTLKY